MGYIVYATSFFELEDQKKYVDKLIVPSYFDSFDLTLIEDLALNYVNEVDYILFTSDVNIDRFPSSKIIGNKKIITSLTNIRCIKSYIKIF